MERYCEQEKNCLRVYVPRELIILTSSRKKSTVFLKNSAISRLPPIAAAQNRSNILSR